MSRYPITGKVFPPNEEKEVSESLRIMHLLSLRAD
jgi:hypothetical protein